LDHSHTWANFTVQSGSYLEVTQVPEGSDSAYQSTDEYLANGEAYDAAVLAYTAPSTATGLHSVSDISITNCQPGDGTPACVGGAVGQSSVVTYSHVVYQWNTAHTGYCATASAGSQTITVLAEWHHYKFSSENLVAISTASNCSRQFRIKTYVKSVSGNGIAVQKDPRSNSISIPS
jgi:hypothetical protein